eukprot:scaffold40876_cov72-Phaeocystis_antarctica.AAC.4
MALATAPGGQPAARPSAARPPLSGLLHWACGRYHGRRTAQHPRGRPPQEVRAEIRIDGFLAPLIHQPVGIPLSWSIYIRYHLGTRQSPRESTCRPSCVRVTRETGAEASVHQGLNTFNPVGMHVRVGLVLSKLYTKSLARKAWFVFNPPRAKHAPFGS